MEETNQECQEPQQTFWRSSALWPVIIIIIDITIAIIVVIIIIFAIIIDAIIIAVMLIMNFIVFIFLTIASIIIDHFSRWYCLRMDMDIIASDVHGVFKKEKTM